ncbi:MAG: hypothetical protein PHO30_07840 [Candidatus Omnitrophica bacterium]|nr:hypothetical protein [Candidatus Omnitrophota bacterium]
MNVIEALKRGWGTAISSIPLIGIIFVLNFASALIMLALVGINPTPEKINSIIFPVMLFFAVLMLIWIVLQGGIITSIISKIKSNDLKLGDFIQNSFKFFPRLLGLNCIGGISTILFIFVGALLVGVFLAVGKGQNIFFNILSFLVGVISIAGTMFVALGVFFGQYLSVIEDSGVVTALKKGFKVFKLCWGRTIGLFLLMAAQVLIASFIINVIVALISRVTGQQTIAIVINVILTSAVNGLVGVYVGASIINLLLSVKEDPASAA